MARQRRSLREDERALWALVARDVVPLRQVPRLPPGADTQKQAAAEAQSRPASPTMPPMAGHGLSTARPQTPGPEVSDPEGLGQASLEQLLAAGFGGGLAVAAAASVRVARLPAPADRIGQRQPGVDDYNWRRFSQGGMRADLRLDLHGMVAQDAFRRLMEFLDVATRRGARCVEVITGLGSGQEGGVLRRELPLWLERPEIRSRILGLAYPHVGNKGSVRVLLRRRKPAPKTGG